MNPLNLTRLLPLAGLLVLPAAAVHLSLSSPLPLWHQLTLILGAPAESFAEVALLHAHLPRLVMALLVGAMLGMVGSLMQQLTQNPLTSPLTLGTSSGAWLALILLNVFFPALVGDYSAVAAMTGALGALGLVIAIAGPRNMTGLPLVLSGMVVNILLGALATAVILLNDQYARNVFIWGAGDLAQSGWESVHWLLPKLALALPLLWLAPRTLALLRLGQQGAAARGLNVVPAFLLLMVAGLWLASAAITVVGVISFIGLLTPNLVRALGARTPRQELLGSLLLGAALLVITDAAALWLSQFTLDVIPSGIMAAVIGAPALLVFSRRRPRAEDRLTIQLPPGRAHLAPWVVPALLLGVLSLVLVTLTLSRYGGQWLWVWPDPFEWALRWPRMTTAACAGIGLALAGTILQRLVYNPLASPDLLGISAGATFTLVLSAMALGGGLMLAGPALAFAGSLLVLGLILLLGRRQQYAPSSLILTGLALTALIEALVQFALAKGSEESDAILRWLSGSTYRVDEGQALLLLAGTAGLGLMALLSRHWLTLIGAGRAFASARGLNVPVASLLLLLLVALLCALVTATMGPVAFVGLLAPHMAVMLGARRAGPQLGLAALIGALLMLLADWLGQVILAPQQVAAGTLVAVIGGGYFLLLLIRGRSHT